MLRSDPINLLLAGGGAVGLFGRRGHASFQARKRVPQTLFPVPASETHSSRGIPSETLSSSRGGLLAGLQHTPSRCIPCKAGHSRSFSAGHW